ncbi:MAG: hypothetical protein KAT46_02205 [Deltaproteobacteria bacterium]|nr:hypothetical protein [Deltaproteobacteria bacterium]
MVGDLVKTIRENLHERISSPLLGAFIISWSVINYRFFMVVFSSESVTEKFTLIDTQIFSDPDTYLLYLIYYPLLSTLCFIFIYPLPASFAYWFWKIYQEQLAKVRQKIEGKALLTLDESMELKNKFSKLEGEYIESLERKDREIERLKKEVEASREKSPSDKERLDKLYPTSAEKPVVKKELELEEEEIEVLRFVYSKGGRVMKDTVLNKGNRILNKHYLSELVSKGLLNITHDNRVLLNPEGTKYLVENELVN